MTTPSDPPPPPRSDASTSTAPPAPFRFLDLPLELREQIYGLYFAPADRLRKSATLEREGFYGGVYEFDLRVMRTSRRVCGEARRVWRREVRTVKVGTPWPSAVNHISSEGLVPIICTDHRANSFNDHHALIQITAPFHQAVPEHAVILLLDDLHLFTQTWYYSALSYPMLNDRLSTALVLRDPDLADVDDGDEKDVPLSVQRRILLPFGQVKGLHSTEIEGFDKTVERELRAAMAVPPPSLRDSCELATAHLQEGDAHLARGAAGAAAALASYTAAFHAIHILIHGRTRRVLADAFFHAHITAGTYAGHTGMTVRVILRLKLVARTIAAHLVLADWAEAAHCGMRSVRIMGDTVDSEFEDFLAELVGGDDVGLVYVRAGIALYKMKADVETWREELKAFEGEEMADVRRLFEVGLKHFKRGRAGARREVELYGLPRSFVGMFLDAEPGLGDDGSVAGHVGSVYDEENGMPDSWL